MTKSVFKSFNLALFFSLISLSVGCKEEEAPTQPLESLCSKLGVSSGVVSIKMACSDVQSTESIITYNEHGQRISFSFDSRCTNGSERYTGTISKITYNSAGDVTAYDAVINGQQCHYGPPFVETFDPPTAVVLKPPFANSSSSILLSWSKNNDANFTKYEVHVSTQQNFVADSTTRITTILDRTITTYNVMNLTLKQAYYSKIRVYNAHNLYTDSKVEKGFTKEGWTFGIGSPSSGSAVIQTSDGNYVIAGYTTPSSSTPAQVYVIKVSPTGTLVWEKTHGKGNAKDIKQTNDGGYILTGSTGAILLMKLDANGLLQWQKQYGGSQYGDDNGYAVQQTSDGGYILTGTLRVSGTSNHVAYVIRTNTSGDTLWTKQIRINGNDWGSDILQTSDGSFIIAGGTSYIEIYHFLIAKIDAQGNLEWKRTSDNTYTSLNVSSICPAIDGGFVIAGSYYPYGSLTSSVYVEAVDSTGKSRWSKTIDKSQDEGASCIIQSGDGGYIIAGSTNSIGAGNYDVYLIKINKFGTVLWEKTFGGLNDEGASSVFRTTDGGFVITGSSKSYREIFWEQDLYLIKTDANGKLE